MVDNKKTFFSVAQFTNESEPIVAMNRCAESLIMVEWIVNIKQISQTHIVSNF